MKFKRAFSFDRRSMPDDICPSFRKIISNRLRFDVFMQLHKRPIEANRPLFVPDFICIFVTQLGNPRNQSRSSKAGSVVRLTWLMPLSWHWTVPDSVWDSWRWTHRKRTVVRGSGNRLRLKVLAVRSIIQIPV